MLGLILTALTAVTGFTGAANAAARQPPVATVRIAVAHGVRPASVNGVADLGALNAYRLYLTALTADASDASSAAAAVVQEVTSDCPGALDDLNSLSPAQLKKSALKSFGNEVDGVLALAYVATSSTILNQFGGALNDLTWSTTAQTKITKTLVQTERRLVNLAPADLCADATTLDAAPLTEPATVKQFLARYRGATANLKAAQNNFSALLAEYETAAERKTVAAINTLGTQYASDAASAEQASATSVLSALGLKS